MHPVTVTCCAAPAACGCAGGVLSCAAAGAPAGRSCAPTVVDENTAIPSATTAAAHVPPANLNFIRSPPCGFAEGIASGEPGEEGGRRKELELPAQRRRARCVE